MLHKNVGVEDKKNLQQIASRLDKIGDDVQKLVVALPKPASRIRRILEMSAMIAGALSIIGIAEIIIKWFIGG